MDVANFLKTYELRDRYLQTDEELQTTYDAAFAGASWLLGYVEKRDRQLSALMALPVSRVWECWLQHDDFVKKQGFLAGCEWALRVGGEGVAFFAERFSSPVCADVTGLVMTLAIETQDVQSLRLFESNNDEKEHRLVTEALLYQFSDGMVTPVCCALLNLMSRPFSGIYNEVMRRLLGAPGYKDLAPVSLVEMMMPALKEAMARRALLSLPNAVERIAFSEAHCGVTIDALRGHWGFEDAYHAFDRALVK